jgi:hypothetical protein
MELNMRIRVLALPAAFILAVPLMASTIYTYTGNDFTTANAPLTTSDSVTGSFTVASPLADNLNGANILTGCVSDGCTTPFSFSDGAGDKITNTTPGIGVCSCSPYIDIFTDGSGNIINWDVSLTVGELGAFSIYTQDYYAGIFSGTVIRDLVFTDEVTYGSNSADAGFWSASTTSAAPEPESLGLLGAGLVALTGAIRWKSRRP